MLSTFRLLHRYLELLGVLPVHFHYKKGVFTFESGLLVYCCCVYLLRQLSCFGIWFCQTQAAVKGKKEQDSYFVTTLLFLFEMSVFVSSTFFVNINLFANRKSLQALLTSIFDNGKKLKNGWHQSVKIVRICIAIAVFSEVCRICLAILQTFLTNQYQCRDIAALLVSVNLVAQRLTVLYEMLLITIICHQLIFVKKELLAGRVNESILIIFEKIIHSMRDFQRIFGWVLLMRQLTVFSTFIMVLYFLQEIIEKDWRLLVKHIEFLVFLPYLLILVYFWHLDVVVQEVLTAFFFQQFRRASSYLCTLIWSFSFQAQKTVECVSRLENYDIKDPKITECVSSFT